MSLYSGKCDLFDHIMMQKTYDMGRYKVSDELECFNIFKEKTGGVIHQHKEIEVTEHNLDFIAEHCKDFWAIPHKQIVKDKRLKKGEKEVTTYTYQYFGKEYKDLKEINKQGVYITIDIAFDTLLDLIPYYPHIVTFSASSEGKQVVYISNESYAIRERDDHFKWGGSNLWEYYNKRLQEHYLEVCERYFLYKIDERTKLIPIENYEKHNENYYKITLDNEIDYMHPVEYVWDDNDRHSRWSGPIILDKHTILLHKTDIERCLADDIKDKKVKLKYIENCEFPKDLS